jgi:hypothetical protein
VTHGVLFLQGFLILLAFGTGWLAGASWRRKVRQIREAKRRARDTWGRVEQLGEALEREREDQRGERTGG